MNTTRLSEFNLLKIFSWAFSLLSISLGFLLMVVMGVEAYRLPEPWFDDAFMYIRYAQNILNGAGFCWNADHSPIYGCTDIPFTYLISAIKAIFPSLSFEAIVIWLPLFNYVVIISLLLVVLIRWYGQGSKSRSLLITGILFLGLVLNPNILYHLFTGMDTILSFSVNVLLILSFLLLERKQTLAFALLAAFAAYLTWLIRPDNLFYSTAFPFLFFLFRLHDRRRIIVIYYVTYILLMSADVVWKYIWFGDVFPLPFYVKSSGYFIGYMGEKDWNALQYTFMFLGYSFVWLALLLVFGSRSKKTYYIVFLFPVLLTVVYFFDAVQIMGTAARYYFPSVPFLLFPAVMSAFDHSIKENNFLLFLKTNPRRIISVVALLAGLYFFAAPVSDVYSRQFLEKRQPFLYAERLSYENAFPFQQETLHDFFDFCQKLPPHVTIAAGENGRLAAYNPNLRIIDLNGLHEPYFAYHGFSADYLMRQSPAVIQLTHYNITKVNYDIITNPEFVSKYNFYPNVYGFGAAVLKTDTVITRLFQSEVAKLYGVSNLQEYTATMVGL